MSKQGKQESTLAYTKDAILYIPEVRITPQNAPAGITLVPLRGYAFGRAVLDAKGHCIGWAAQEDWGWEVRSCSAPLYKQAAS